MRIVLVGFMACGKTTVGDLLAKKLNKLQIDLDQAIVEIVEREKLTIPEIFAKFGEDHFRLCEHRDLLANIGKDAVNHDRHRDLRNVLERSSARETTLRVALGNIAQHFLRQLYIDLVAYVAQVGPVEADSEKPLDVSQIRQKIFQNDMHVIDQDKVEDLHQLILETKEKGDTLGGIIRLVATGLPAGLGSCVSWDTKLDAKLAAAAVGVNAMGNSGTTNRLLLGILAGSSFASQLIGDASLSKRPMKRVSQPLAKFGAEIALSPAGTLPATVIGQKLHGAEIQMEVASAQVKSAAIFAALEADSPSTIIEKLPTRNHTEIMLRQFGADITTEVDNLTIHVQPGQELLGQEVEVPGDMSSAAFWLTAGRLRKPWPLMS